MATENRPDPATIVRVDVFGDQQECRVDGDSDAPRIRGLGAVYYDGSPETEYELFPGVVERIMPGAFDRAIAEGDDVRGLKNHNPDLLLGRTTAGTMQLRSTKDGLAYEIDPPDTQVGRDTVTQIRRRDITGSSFGFRVESETWKDDKERRLEIREINSVELFDVGPVTYPAYRATSAIVRAEDSLLEARSSHEKRRDRREGKLIHDTARRRRRHELNARVEEILGRKKN